MKVRNVVLAIASIAFILTPSSVAFAAGGGGGAAATTGGADIQVTGSASTGSPAPTGTYWYTWQVKNSGPQTATGTVLTTSLPAGETLNWAQLQNYAFVINCTTAVDSSGTTNITCPVGDMLSGSQQNILIDVNAPPVVGTVSDTATVSSSVPDPKPANNSFTVNVQVKSGTCTVPAAQTTLFGLAMSATYPSSFQYLSGGVTYTVFTNFLDATQPLTTIVSLSCQPTGGTLIPVGTNVYVTGVVDSVNHTITASVIQTLFKDLGA